jgi:hypothetical protein
MPYAAIHRPSIALGVLQASLDGTGIACTVEYANLRFIERDGWHASPRTPADFREGLAKLRAAAEAARRPWETIEISLRFGLSDALLGQGPQAAIDQLGEYKRLGVRHALIEFRRDELKRMLEILDLVTKTIRPAVDAA